MVDPCLVTLQEINTSERLRLRPDGCITLVRKTGDVKMDPSGSNAYVKRPRIGISALWMPAGDAHSPVYIRR